MQCRRREIIPVEVPVLTGDFEYSIKHLESGVKFRFGPSDAISQCYNEQISLLEKEIRSPNYTHRRGIINRFPRFGTPLLPAYHSPLRPAGGYDSAYVGRIRFNECVDFDPYAWEHIDLEILHVQIVWVTENQKLSGRPYTEFFYLNDAPKKAKKMLRKQKDGWRKSKEGLVHPILNFVVVIESGWFVSLRHVYCQRNGARRKREMIMQYNFKLNIICRKIIKTQSKHFSKRRGKVSREVRVVFHEAKQMKIQENATSIRRSHLIGRSMQSRIALGDVTNVCTNLSYAFNEAANNEMIPTPNRMAIQCHPNFRHPNNLHMHKQKGKVHSDHVNATSNHCVIESDDNELDNSITIDDTDMPELGCHDESSHQYNTMSVHPDYMDFGNPEWACSFCGGLMWFQERVNKNRKTKNPEFTMCCARGKVSLPLMREPPCTLRDLLYGFDSRSKHFLDNIRAYNMMFSFTSMGGKIDRKVNNGSGPYVFKLHGQNYHRIGSLLPSIGSAPKFAQLYIYDTENEVANRMSAISSGNNEIHLEASIVEALQKMIDQYNVLAHSFRQARNRFESHGFENFKLKLICERQYDGRRYNISTAGEVAGIVIGDIGSSTHNRDIIVESQNGVLKQINELHPSYLALEYPLLFPYGEDGYRRDIPMSGSRKLKRETISMREFFCFRIQQRNGEPHTLLISRKLFQQFLVDAFTMIEAERLSFIRCNQKNLRAEMYKGLAEAVLRGENTPSSRGKRIILPSSYVGGARYMIQNYQDAMAICRWAGYPDIFITFTCNPKWLEIQRFVAHFGLKPEDRPDIMCRIFKMKLDQLVYDLKHDKIFGRVKAVLYTIEFQKRGLPHAHILVFLHSEDKHPNGPDIDKIISAEIPDESTNPRLYKVVDTSMMHGPCGDANPKSPCMQDGKCTKHFPKRYIDETVVGSDGYPLYMRRDNGKTIEKNGHALDNRFVVPYNAYLLLKYDAHINVEWCNQSRSIKYLFKYVNKGNDRITITFYRSNGSGKNDEVFDEINNYYDCRYISPCEAIWRIMGFPINYREPAVERLSFHLPGEHTVVFRDDEPIDSALARTVENNSMFLEWMEANKVYEEAQNLTYAQFPQNFVWKYIVHNNSIGNKEKRWYPRKRGMSVDRLFYVHPGAGELYYLRILLNTVRGPTCYEDIRTVNGVLYPSFRDACFVLGLLDDDKQYIDGITEASFWGSGHFLRCLFVTMLHSNSISRPEFVWESTWKLLTDDILRKQRNILNNQDLLLSDDQLKNYGLAEIEKLLNRNGKSLKDYHPMPLPDSSLISNAENRLVYDELAYDRESLKAEHDNLFNYLNEEQLNVYNEVVNAVSNDRGGMFFVYGYGGTRKTYIWRTFSSALRSKGHIVLTVASSGIASLLIPGGRIAHSRFGIPLVITEDSTCNIAQTSPLAELLTKTRLIIWDESPMVHKHCFEALDRTLRDLLRFKNPNSHEMPFGGKVVVFGGDFRQTLPVIPKGRRQDVVSVALCSSYLWNSCKVLKLTKNMRLQNGSSNTDPNELKDFSDWILKIGDGTINGENEENADVAIPDDIIIKNVVNPLQAIVQSTYPNLFEEINDGSYIQERAILAPTLEVVHQINEYVLSIWPGKEETYLSSDSVCKVDEDSSGHEDVYTVEFLNSITSSGIPNHKLKLKVGVPIMLLRNTDQSSGLCNGTRLIVTQLGKHVIEAKIICGDNAGHKVFIPRLTLAPSDLRLPFKFQRRQFPVVVCFAMTINKSQGQSLSHVGLYLPRPVFCHRQLYVAVSRVKSRSGLKILNCDKDGNTCNHTKNVVYKEIFQYLS